MKVILKNLLVPKFETNIKYNISKIENLIGELGRKKILKCSISDVERKIVGITEQIEKLILSLYGLNKKQKQIIEEFGKITSTSEYFDRLEEYVGLEDIVG